MEDEPKFPGPDEPAPSPSARDDGNPPTSPAGGPESEAASPPGPDPRIAQLEAELTQARTQAQELSARLARAERTRDLQRQFIAAGAVDLDAAMTLAERDIGESVSPDLAAIVRTIRRRTPSLFRSPPRLTATGVGRSDESITPDDLAAVAAATGSRRAVLNYLRARRGW